MSGMTTEQEAWVKSALGFDINAALQAEGGDEQGKEAAPESGAPEDEKFSLSDLAFWKKKPKEEPKAEGEGDSEKTPEPKDADLLKALKAIADEVASLKKLGFDTKQIEGERTALVGAGNKAEAVTEQAARKKALDDVKQRAADVLSHAKGLSKSVKDVMGKSKDSPNADQKNQIYKKALEDQYGITVTIPPGMTNTHLDRTFDMFGSVPKGDAKQDKLKKLTYVKDGMAGGGSYNRGTFEVKMGDFGDASGTEDYQVDGTVLPANSFDVTTLHEIGHAVDNKNSFMKNNGSKAGCGGWEAQDVDKVTAAYLPECKTEATPSDKVTDDMLTAVIKTALSAGTTAKPDNIEQGDWDKIVVFLTKKCLPIRAASKPWFKGSQVVVGGKVYQEAYSNQWWSYDPAARGTTKVNGYQWRAPGEWFAEVYAITWLKKTKPPSGVDASAAALMWQG